MAATRMPTVVLSTPGLSTVCRDPANGDLQLHCLSPSSICNETLGAHFGMTLLLVSPGLLHAHGQGSIHCPWLHPDVQPSGVISCCAGYSTWTHCASIWSASQKVWHGSNLVPRQACTFEETVYQNDWL